MLLKVIACEIAFREICHAAARSPNLLDLEFVTQGYHDTPKLGCAELQRRIDAVPVGRYDAILLGYGLCSNILTGLHSAHTPLVVPRAHDCITFLLGSKERYQTMFDARPGTYYFSSGWLECRRRRDAATPTSTGALLPAHALAGMQAAYEAWVAKYGEEKAAYLREVMQGWAATYGHGVLIDFDFTKPLAFADQVRQLCAERGWQFEEVAGDLSLLQRWLDGEWHPQECLLVPPGRRIVPTYDPAIIGLESSPPTPAPAPTSPGPPRGER